MSWTSWVKSVKFPFFKNTFCILKKNFQVPWDIIIPQRHRVLGCDWFTRFDQSADSTAVKANFSCALPSAYFKWHQSWFLLLSFYYCFSSSHNTLHLFFKLPHSGFLLHPVVAVLQHAPLTTQYNINWIWHLWLKLQLLWFSEQMETLLYIIFLWRKALQIKKCNCKLI